MTNDADVSGDYDPLNELLTGNRVFIPGADADVFAETLVRVGVRFERVDSSQSTLFRLTPDAIGRAFLAPDTETGPSEDEPV